MPGILQNFRGQVTEMPLWKNNVFLIISFLGQIGIEYVISMRQHLVCCLLFIHRTH